MTGSFTMNVGPLSLTANRQGRLVFLAATLAAVAFCGAAIVIDGSTAHHVFDGVGALSAGAASRSLYDYPDAQRADILDLLFKPSFGASIHILKVEIGGDAQSTDGSEPSHMHTRDDLSCSRGYEGWLMAEAKKRNPDILTYGLSWAVPRWVGDGAGNGTGYHSPDNWLYQTRWLECIRSTTGTTVDFIGDWNEKPMGPPEYVKGLRAALDAAGFASTKISLMDSDYSLNNLVAQATADPAFNASFAYVGRHYSCDYPFPGVEAVLHKPYWSSEDWSMTNDWAGTSCWARLLNQNYVRMNMTSTIAWSLVWSAPQGLPFPGTGLLTAQEPWSGHYSGGASSVGSSSSSLNGPVWATAHTTQFVQPGWRYLLVGGGGSGLLPASAGNGSYVTLVPPTDLSAFTIVIEKVVGACKCNPAGAGETADGTVQFAVAGGLPGAGTVLHVWRTNETSQFWQDADITVAQDGTFSVFVARDSIVTVTTTSGASHGTPASLVPASAPFPVPYADNFDSYPDDTTPVRFWADQTGSFAVRSGALTQVVPMDPGPNRWTAEDVDPLTVLGDSSLGDVTVAVGATFSAAANASGSGAGAFGFTYVQACARVTGYTGFRNGPPPGYCMAVNASGAWVLRAGSTDLDTGQLDGPFDPTSPHTIVVQLSGQVVTAWVLNDPPPLGPPSGPALVNATSTAYTAGLVALGSGYHAAAFDDFTLTNSSAGPVPSFFVPPVSVFDVSWASPSPNQTDREDGMPTGNGRVAALVWGNATAGGLDFYVNSPLAMATDSTLLALARVSVRLQPNPCFNTSAYWNQTHHLQDGSVALLCGGTSFQDYVAAFTLYVDANADVIVVTAASRDGTTPFSLSVEAQATRPGPREASWYADFHCPPSGQTTPDVVIPLGPGVAIYHINSLAAGDTPFFANQMTLQGLAALLPDFPDPLDGRMFGLMVTGAASADGSGAPLARASNSTLVSAAPAPAFFVRIDVRVDPDARGNATAFLAALVAQAASGPTPAERAASSAAWWTQFWNRSYIYVNGGAPPPRRGPPPPPELLAAQYARTRFIQAVQSRGHNVPIKFNGQLWVQSRQWGPDHWWQNTRLPYGSMLAAGDVEEMRVVLDWVTGFIPLASARTAALLPGQKGIFFTEVSDINGLYQGGLYGCDNATDHPPGYPLWLEGKVSGGWTRFDFGGNGHGPQAGLMALDYYWMTQDVAAAQKYIPIATQSLDFYISHYPNRTSDGKLLIWPSQALETYWCDWPGWNASDCVSNDLPQVAAVTALARGLLSLPEASGLLTPQQRSEYSAFAAILPPLPNNGSYFLPAASYPSQRHNSETPELYGSHPFRLVTVGRAVVDPSNAPAVTMGVNTYLNASINAGCNDGWCQGIMNTALLGLANQTLALAWERATAGPAQGFRYPAFAPKYQDAAPSADHYANMMTAMQLMLLQSGEDGPTGSLVLLPSWPCHMDVAFKLWGAFNTSVEVMYAAGKLQYLDVQPPSRAGAVKWANCVAP